MIDFLKESTFAVNDVINKAWQLLKEQYFLIAGLCFLMFVTLNLSTFLAAYFSEVYSGIKVLIMLVFMVVYFGLQLTLFKFSIILIDTESHLSGEFFKIRMYNYIKLMLVLTGAAMLCSVVLTGVLFVVSSYIYEMDVPLEYVVATGILLSIIWRRKNLYPFVVIIRNYWPRRQQLVNFVGATLVSVALLLLAFLLMAVILLPVIYMHVKTETVTEIAISLGAVLAMVVLIRISFFPLFIMDRDCNPFKAIRFSLAITRGNFTRLVLLLAFLALFHFLSGYFSLTGYPILLFLVNVINSFLIVPLSSLITAVAYRQMMSEYKGDQDPDLIHNLI